MQNYRTMKKKTILLAFAAVVMMSSCSTSESALNDLRNLSHKIEVEGATYGYSDWARVASKYYDVDQKIVKHIQKREYTDQEMEEIGVLQGECVGGFAKGLGQNLSNAASNIGSLVKGLVKGIKENFNIQ